MNSTKLRDPGEGWNVGLHKAFTLPDGPFKLYVWLRLNVRIDTGALEISQSDLSLALNKTRGTIRANLKTLEEAGVCRLKFSHDPQGRGWIEITDDYWPYEREQERKADAPELVSYLEKIRNILDERACIRKPFSTTDELLAREWYAQGVTIECVGQAVLMGCARKYVSWRNGAPHTPIGSLHYFQPILEEVKEQNAPAEYWEYTRYRIERMEKLWISGKDPNRFPRFSPPGNTKIPSGEISGDGPGQNR
jgi:DNA-binding MarR family transcriptional regulator